MLLCEVIYLFVGMVMLQIVLVMAIQRFVRCSAWVYLLIVISQHLPPDQLPPAPGQAATLNNSLSDYRATGLGLGLGVRYSP